MALYRVKALSPDRSKVEPSLGWGDDELGVAEHVAGMRHLLQAQAVDRLDVGNGDDAVAFHDVQADARDPAVGLVVDEQVLAVVLAVGHRDVRMVAVAVEEARAVAEDPLALVGQAPAGGRVDVEHRYAHQLAHRRHAEHAYFAGMSAAPEPVVLIQFAGGDLGLAALALARGPGLAADHRAAQGAGANQGGGSGQRRGAEEAAAVQAVGFFVGAFRVVAHLVSSSRAVRGKEPGQRFSAGIRALSAGALFARFLRLFTSGGHLSWSW